MLVNLYGYKKEVSKYEPSKFMSYICPTFNPCILHCIDCC